MILRILLFLVFAPIFMHARGKVIWEQVQPNLEPPWLTGPLIAPASRIVPWGHYNIEPYLFCIAYTGTYNSRWQVTDASTFWNNSLVFLTQIGLSPWMNLTLTPTLIWNDCQHQTSWQIGDMWMGFDIQLYKSRQDFWIPSVKLSLKENIPFGKYRHLNPKKLMTDAGGVGSWATNAGLVFGNLYHFYSVYYLAYRLALNYVLPAPVRLKGFNYYGGGYGTNARFFPPENFQTDLAFEVTLAQTWAFAIDFIGYWAGKGHFNGVRGVNAAGASAKLGRGSQAQFSLAPAIEYNWNPNLGMIAGSWFTFAGRKAPAFASAVIALNYYK